MSLRRKLLIPILLVVVAGSVTGGVVMAQDRGDRQDRVLARAAEILGVEQDELGDALARARSEIRDAEVDALIDRLTDEGVITDDEAAQIRVWLAGRPDSLEKLDKNALASLFGLTTKLGLGAHSPGIRIDIPRIQIERHIQLGSGRLTDEDLAGISEWLERMPESLRGTAVEDAADLGREQVRRRLAGEDPLPDGVDGLVEAGVLMQHQAEDLENWLDGRPDIAKGLLPHSFGLPGTGGLLPGFGGHRPNLHIPQLFGRGDLPGLHEDLVPNVDDLLRRFREFREGQEPGDIEGFLDDFRAELEERFDRNGFGEGFFEFRFGNDSETFCFQFPPNDADEPVADPTSDQLA